MTKSRIDPSRIKCVIERFSTRRTFDTRAGSGICLRIGIDKQYLSSAVRKACGEVHGGRGLSDSAFLICNGYYLGHEATKLIN